MNPTKNDNSIYDRFEANSVEIRSLLSRCLRNWYLFVLLGIVAFASAWLFLQSQVPEYSISSRILIQEDQKNRLVSGPVFGNNANLFSENLAINNEVEVLKSRRLLKQIVDELQLNVRYYTIERFVDEEVFKSPPIKIRFLDSAKFFYNKQFFIEKLSTGRFEAKIFDVDQSNGSLVALDTLVASFGRVSSINDLKFVVEQNLEFEKEIKVQVLDPLSLAISLSRKLSIEPIIQSEVLDVSLSDNIPFRAVIVLNKLIDVYNKQVLENKNQSTRNTIDFIDERLLLITQELNEVEGELETFKRDNDVPFELSQNAQQFLDRAIVTDDRISEIELQQGLLDGVRKRLDEAEAVDNSLLAVDLTIDGSKPTILEEYNDLINLRNEITVSATASNPQVVAIDSQISRAKQSLKSWLAFKISDLESKKVFLVEKKYPISSRIDAIPRFEREMLQIIRQQVIKEELFTFLLQKREENALKLASEVNNARIINDPVFDRKLSPNKPRTYIIFMLLGLGIPLVGMIIFEYYDNYIESREDILSVVDVPFLGEIPLANKDYNPVTLVNRKSIVSEMFRMVRTNLKYLNNGKLPKSILITSSFSGEGKTFVAVNIAASIAYSGKKVVLLGFDLRKPRLSEYLANHKPSNKGISNFLVNPEQELSELIHQHKDLKEFYFIESGPIPPNPYELIVGDHTAKFFEELHSRFDVVVVDSAPIGLVADAFGLKDYVDTSIFVTRFNSTSKANLGIISDVIENHKLPKLAVILNGYKKRLGSRNLTGYSYKYSYGFGYYDDYRTNWWERLKQKAGFSK